jgi:cyclopropane-fatty-acyl-phospholipid synthase
MSKISAEEQIIGGWLASAGIKINGNALWDIQVHNPKFYARALSDGSLGLGESYMEGMWDCAALDQLMYRIQRSQLSNKLKPNLKIVAHVIKNKVINLQRKSNAFNLKHYDIGNEMYRKMLDSRMTYTCGYWANANNLEEAQEAKLEMVCRKIGLKSGMKVLDIGCGWGSFMKYAVEHYGVSCVGITISQSQIDLGKEICKGLPIEFRLQDYRDLSGQYDAIVSIGMFEHVGPKNYKTFMSVVSKCLKDDGLFLLHTMGGNDSNPVTNSDPWMNKYIFPNGITPSIKQVGAALEGNFVMEDWHNFGADYDKTLLAWRNNFVKAWPDLQNDYDQTFYRMWMYFLLACAGSSRARIFELWQIVLSKRGLVGGYKSIRAE